MENSENTFSEEGSTNTYSNDASSTLSVEEKTKSRREIIQAFNKRLMARNRDRLNGLYASYSIPPRAQPVKINVKPIPFLKQINLDTTVNIDYIHVVLKDNYNCRPLGHKAINSNLIKILHDTNKNHFKAYYISKENNNGKIMNEKFLQMNYFLQTSDHSYSNNLYKGQESFIKQMEQIKKNHLMKKTFFPVEFTKNNEEKWMKQHIYLHAWAIYFIIRNIENLIFDITLFIKVEH